MPSTEWADSGTPANASYTDETPLANSAFTETNPNTSAWARNSGIDTDVPTYNDATISYDDSATYFDGYAADVITTDDVCFSAWSGDNVPSLSSWTDAT